MTVLHLAARYGHVDVLEVLRGKVPWNMASVKVVHLSYLSYSFTSDTSLLLDHLLVICFHAYKST